MNNFKISVIVFDLGNVLIPFDYDILINRLNSKKAGLGNKFQKMYKDNYNIHRKFETWEISTEKFTAIMLDWLEHEFTKEEFYHLFSDIFSENYETTALLPKLRKNYKLVLLSNTNFIHQKYGWEKYNFLKYFDKLILSHEVGAVKPEPKIYEAVEKFTGAEPDEHLFIDDIEDYAEGAKRMGWHAIQFKNHNQLIDELTKRKIKIN